MTDQTPATAADGSSDVAIASHAHIQICTGSYCGLPIHTCEALDRDALAEAILAEFDGLWGEPSDAYSARVRPHMARAIAERYEVLAREAPAASPEEER